MEYKRTTAGQRSDYAYEKLIQLLVESVLHPKESFIMGGTWRIPVIAGLQQKKIVDDKRNDETYSEIAFEREYESKWVGDSDQAFFNGDYFDRGRVIKQPDYAFTNKAHAIERGSFYVVAADVGRSPRGCQTAVLILKCIPANVQGQYVIKIVNIITWKGEHFEEQAIELKKLYYKYKARRLVIDANGVGYGLVDFLVKPQGEPGTPDYMPDFGVYNDDEYNNEYKKYRTEETEQDAIYMMKATPAKNSEAYGILQEKLASSRIKFLLEEREARVRLMNSNVGVKMSPERRVVYLLPYTLTDILKEELLNLRQEPNAVNTILKQISRSIGKDKVSALIYGLYYVRKVEENRIQRRKFKASEWKFFN